MKIHHAIAFVPAVALLLGITACDGSSGGGTTGEAATEGTVVVTVQTSGTPVDNEYLVTIGDSTEPIGPNGSLTFNNVPVGLTKVGLGGLDSDCAVQGENPVNVRLEGGTVEVKFDVSCVATTGTVEVTTVTNGDVDPDEDGYTVELDGRLRAIGANETILFSGVDPGTYTVAVDDLAGNCTLDASTTLDVSVVAGETASLEITVNCVPKGDIEVTFESVGNGDPDNDGYVLQLPDATIAVNTDETITSPRFVAGDVELTLTDLARRCTVEGDNPRTITVESGVTAMTTFTVACNSSQLWVPFDGTLLDNGAQPQPHDATVVGDATFGTETPNASGLSMAFDGAGDSVTFGNAEELNVSSSAYTVAMWMRPSAVMGTQVIWAKASQGEIPGVTTPALYLEGDELRFGLFGGAPQTISAGIVANTWYHVGVTHDGATAYQPYLTGIPTAAANLAAANEGDNGEAAWTFSVGSSTGWPTGDFAGQIDDVVFFARELTAPEMAQLRSDGPARL